MSAYKKQDYYNTKQYTTADTNQTTKVVATTYNLHISDHKGDAGKNFDYCPQEYATVQ